MLVYLLVLHVDAWVAPDFVSYIKQDLSQLTVITQWFYYFSDHAYIYKWS